MVASLEPTPIAPTATTTTTNGPAPHAADSHTPHAHRVALLRARWAAVARDWRYSGGKRDLRLDFLRGFAVLAMVADHLGGEPSWLYSITGGNKFLFSAAEGFVFISGLVMGIVYAGMIAKSGIGPAMWKALRRAGNLYMFTVILTLSFVTTSYLTKMPWVAGVHVADPPARLVEWLALHRAFYLTDVILMYTLLIAVAPLAFLLIVNKRTPVLLGGSWLLWAAFQRWPDQVTIPWTIEDNSVFHLAAWQVLFFTGLVIGYHRERIASWARRIPMMPYLTALTALCAGLIWFHCNSAAILSRFSPDGDPTALTTQFFDKSDVRIGRLIAFAIFFQFFLAVVTVAWKPLAGALGWLLLPLGQSALLAYSTHLFVIVLFTKYVHSIPGFHNTAAFSNTVVQLTGIFLVYTVVRLAPAVMHAVVGARETVTALVAPSHPILAAPRRVIERRDR
jgi:hypothetical protein